MAKVQNLDRTPYCPEERNDVLFNAELGVFLPAQPPEPAVDDSFWYVRRGPAALAIFCGAVAWGAVFGIAAAVSSVLRSGPR